MWMQLQLALNGHVVWMSKKDSKKHEASYFGGSKVPLLDADVCTLCVSQ